MAVVLRWFGVNTILTAAGAYVFAFGLIRVDHLTQQQLMPQYFSPFAVWYAWAMVREPTARRWCAARSRFAFCKCSPACTWAGSSASRS